MEHNVFHFYHWTTREFTTIHSVALLLMNIQAVSKGAIASVLLRPPLSLHPGRVVHFCCLCVHLEQRFWLTRHVDGQLQWITPDNSPCLWPPAHPWVRGTSVRGPTALHTTGLYLVFSTLANPMTVRRHLRIISICASWFLMNLSFFSCVHWPSVRPYLYISKTLIQISYPFFFWITHQFSKRPYFPNFLYVIQSNVYTFLVLFQCFLYNFINLFAYANIALSRTYDFINSWYLISPPVLLQGCLEIPCSLHSYKS